ncbi:MAG: hypothetical protein KJ956_05895 [Actinobacteria bacterium]|nr:hypothetical protein [Actinomycetota bacterium]
MASYRAPPAPASGSLSGPADPCRAPIGDHGLRVIEEIWEAKGRTGVV